MLAVWVVAGVCVVGVAFIAACLAAFVFLAAKCWIPLPSKSRHPVKHFGYLMARILVLLLLFYVAVVEPPVAAWRALCRTCAPSWRAPAP